MAGLLRVCRGCAGILFGAMLGAACGWVLHQYGVGRALERQSYDLLLVSRGDVPVKGALLVYLDEKTHQTLNQPLNAPFDRELHARMIDRLTQAGARAIVLDIVFSDPDPQHPQKDQALADAIRRSGRVVLAADNIPIGPKSKQAIPPFDLLLDTGAAIGSAEVVPDRDMVVRQHTPEDLLPSLAWAAAELAGVEAVKTERVASGTRWINYYGAPNRLPWVSFCDALDPQLTPDSLFSNQVVFVGARIMTRFAGQRKDEYSNPFSQMDESQATFMPGVELHATAFLNLERGDWLRRLPTQAELWFIILFGVFVGGGLSRRVHPAVLTSIGVAGWIMVAVMAFVLFRFGRTWFPWLILEVQIGAILTWSVTYNAIRLYVQKRLYEHTLGLYLSPKLVKKFASSPQLLKPGAEKQVITMVFSDIADFTRHSEGMDSDELAKMMNRYFQSAVRDCIHKTDGTVVKYIGDAIFAFWNAPEAQEDHAYRACCAALYFNKRQTVLPSGEALRTRIGLHTGVANVGNFGSEDRVDYTALGESVNLASRIEGLNKFLGTECLASGTTMSGIGDRLVTRNLGWFQLKGFEHPVEILELLGFPEEAEATREWRAAFAEALTNYHERNLEFASAGFQRVLQMHPEDGPSKFYLERIAELSRQPLPDAWATHTMLKEK